MGFIEDWNGAIEADPYWQFEELLEDDPELAEYVWDCQRIAVLVEKRMARNVKEE